MISPELRENGKPMNQAVYYNWKEENDIPFLNNHKCGLSIHDWLAEQNLLFMK